MNMRWTSAGGVENRYLEASPMSLSFYIEAGGPWRRLSFMCSRIAEKGVRIRYGGIKIDVTLAGLGHHWSPREC